MLRGSGYLPSLCSNFALRGFVYNHPNHADGAIVYTSAIASFKESYAMTASGSNYVLGEPDAGYLAWINTRGIVYDPYDPFRGVLFNEEAQARDARRPA